MCPASDMQVRMTEEDLQVGEYTVPKGWLMMTSVVNAHFLPEVFSNPHEYDPTRFSPERQEDKKTRFSLLGFGGGVHKCPGMNFALNEMHIIATLMFQQFDITLETPDPQLELGLGAVRPTETWISYKRKPLTELTSEKIVQQAFAGGCPHMMKMMEQEAAKS